MKQVHRAPTPTVVAITTLLLFLPPVVVALLKLSVVLAGRVLSGGRELPVEAVTTPETVADVALTEAVAEAVARVTTWLATTVA